MLHTDIEKVVNKEMMLFGDEMRYLPESYSGNVVRHGRHQTLSSPLGLTGSIPCRRRPLAQSSSIAFKTCCLYVFAITFLMCDTVPAKFRRSDVPCQNARVPSWDAVATRCFDYFETEYAEEKY